jgi:uncharacterized protein with PIN domain
MKKAEKIIIKSREEFKAESLKFAKALDRGEKPETQKGEYFESLGAALMRCPQCEGELMSVVRETFPYKSAAGAFCQWSLEGHS